MQLWVDVVIASWNKKLGDMDRNEEVSIENQKMEK